MNWGSHGLNCRAPPLFQLSCNMDLAKCALHVTTFIFFFFMKFIPPPSQINNFTFFFLIQSDKFIHNIFIYNTTFFHTNYEFTINNYHNKGRHISTIIKVDQQMVTTSIWVETGISLLRE